MPSRAASYLRTAAFAGLIAMAACSRGDGNNLAAIDNELIANGTDPALTSALEDQIMVDPNLVQQANPNTVRPPETPVQAQYPADAAPQRGGVRVARASAASGAGGPAPAPSSSSCGAPFDHGPQWANRLPPEFPAYPGGRLIEAAGNNHGDCRMRVVVFTTSDPYGRVLEHYQGVAARAGFSAEHQTRGGDQVLGGTRGDAAYYLIVTPARAGSEVALIVNNGR
jgi:hypothetical protein